MSVQLTDARSVDHAPSNGVTRVSQHRIQPTLEGVDLELGIEETLQFVTAYQVQQCPGGLDGSGPTGGLQISGQVAYPSTVPTAHLGCELAVRGGVEEHLVLGPDEAFTGPAELAADDLDGEPAHSLQGVGDRGTYLFVDGPQKAGSGLEIETKGLPEQVLP